MSAIFQRPLCDMGRVYEYSFRPLVGDPDPGSGGGCDEYPHRVEVYAAAADPRTAPDSWRPFGLCTEHEAQLRQYDARIQSRGTLSRFRPASGAQGSR